MKTQTHDVNICFHFNKRCITCIRFIYLRFNSRNEKCDIELRTPI